MPGPMDLRLGGALYASGGVVGPSGGSAAGVAADLEAETVNGHLSNDFGIPVNKHKYVGADMTGSIGSGGGEVRLNTVNGKIQVVKK